MPNWNGNDLICARKWFHFFIFFFDSSIEFWFCDSVSISMGGHLRFECIGIWNRKHVHDTSTEMKQKKTHIKRDCNLSSATLVDTSLAISPCSVRVDKSEKFGRYSVLSFFSSCFCWVFETAHEKIWKWPKRTFPMPGPLLRKTHFIWPALERLTLMLGEQSDCVRQNVQIVHN